MISPQEELTDLFSQIRSLFNETMKDEFLEIQIDSTSPSCLSSFLSLINKQISTSYDSLLIFHKSSISLSLPHNLWGDDYLLGSLDSNPWSVRCQQSGHVYATEVVHDWIRVSSRIRFTKSVVVSVPEGSFVFVAVEVGIFETDKRIEEEITLHLCLS